MNKQKAIDAYNVGVKFWAQGNVRGAIEYYDKALQFDTELLEAYENRGVARAAVGDTEGAFEDYERVIQLNPLHFYVYYNRARLKEQIGDINGAIQDYTRAIKINPKAADIICNRGIAYRLAGDMQNALVDLDTALKLNPKDWIAYYNRGCIFQSAGQLNKAITDLTTALQINPDFPQGFHHRAIAHSFAGNVTAAVQDFQRVLSLVKAPPHIVKEIQLELWRLKARKDNPLVGKAAAMLKAFAYKCCGPEHKYAGFLGMLLEDLRWKVLVLPMYLFTENGFEREIAAATLDLCSSPPVLIRVSPLKGGLLQSSQYEITFLTQAPNPALPVPGYVEIFTDKVAATEEALSAQLVGYLKQKKLIREGNKLELNIEFAKLNMKQVWVFQAEAPPDEP
jgi:tetratricopeptide (TPR) repeat protein